MDHGERLVADQKIHVIGRSGIAVWQLPNRRQAAWGIPASWSIRDATSTALRIFRTTPRSRAKSGLSLASDPIALYRAAPDRSAQTSIPPQNSQRLVCPESNLFPGRRHSEHLTDRARLHVFRRRQLLDHSFQRGSVERFRGREDGPKFWQRHRPGGFRKCFSRAFSS